MTLVPHDVLVGLANQYSPCGLKTCLSVTLCGLRSLLHPVSLFSFYNVRSEDESDISHKVIHLQIKHSVWCWISYVDCLAYSSALEMEGVCSFGTWWTSARLHDITSRKITLLMVIVERNSDVTSVCFVLCVLFIYYKNILLHNHTYLCR